VDKGKHASDRDYFWPTANQYLSSNLLSVEGSMVDAVLNAALFAALVLCIVGFGAWAHRRVPWRHDQFASRQAQTMINRHGDVRGHIQSPIRAALRLY
jgi:hypothetical protein